MLVSGLLAIGIHLLITTKVSYSLVLLTANLEDIKKIARQFVSETVADQIGKLFIQTNVNHNISISEENNLNDDVNKVSSEDFEMPKVNKTSSEDVENILKAVMQRVKEMKDVFYVTKRQKKPEKEKRKTQKDNTKASTKTSNHYTYDFILTPEKTRKPKYEWKKGLNFDFLPTPNVFKQNEIYNTFTRGAISDTESNSDFNRIDKLSSDHEMDRRFEKSFNRLEPKIQRLKYKKPEVTKRNNKHESIKLHTDNTIESNVLDYNDKSIYVKKEIVATSGPIELLGVTALKEITSSSSEYSLDRENKDKNVNVDLYFRKLLDSKLKQYKNDTKVIQAQIANSNFNTSNKFFVKNIITTKELPLHITKVNTTKFRRMKEKTQNNNVPYLGASYEIYYSK